MKIIWITVYLGLIGAGLVTLYLTLIGAAAIVVALASSIREALRRSASAYVGSSPDT